MIGGWNFARRPFRNERPVLATIAVAVLAGLVLLAANVNLYVRFSKRVQGTRAEIDQLETRRARANGSADQARSALNTYKLSTLAEESAGLQTIVRERRFSWLTLLAQLERTLPTDVRLTRLNPHFGTSDAVEVDLAVEGRTGDSVVRTIAALSKSPAFQRVDLRSEATPEHGVPEGYTFQILLRYLPPESR